MGKELGSNHLLSSFNHVHSCQLHLSWVTLCSHLSWGLGTIFTQFDSADKLCIGSTGVVRPSHHRADTHVFFLVAHAVGVEHPHIVLLVVLASVSTVG